VFFFVLEWFGTSFQTFFLSLNGSEQNPVCFSLLRMGTEFGAFLFSPEWFGMKLRSFQCFLFNEMLRTEFRAFLSLAEWFRTKLRSSASFYLLRKGSEQNYELFLFSEEWIGTEFLAWGRAE
jgi:hypothetical protein